MLLHWNMRITGKVQGVFYRATARGEANKLGVHGFIRNQEDGSVFAEAEGLRKDLEAFAAWCRKGPPHAAVESVVIEAGDVLGYRGFHVR